MIRRLAHLAAQVRSVVALIGHCLGYTTPVRDPPGDDSLAFRFFFFFRFAEKEKKGRATRGGGLRPPEGEQKSIISHSFTYVWNVDQCDLLPACEALLKPKIKVFEKEPTQMFPKI